MCVNHLILYSFTGKEITPLLEFIRDKKAEKARFREERKDARKRRDDERRKAREEERKRKKVNAEKNFLEMMNEKTKGGERYEAIDLDELEEEEENRSTNEQERNRDSKYKDETERGDKGRNSKDKYGGGGERDKNRDRDRYREGKQLLFWKYSGDLNTKLVWYSNGPKRSEA